MLRIRPEDIEYVKAELKRMHDTDELIEWEQALVKNSEPFLLVLARMILEMHGLLEAFRAAHPEDAQVNHFVNPRAVFTLVYGAAYSARGKTFPNLATDEIDRLFVRVDVRYLERSVTTAMHLMSPAWLHVFRNYMQGYEKVPVVYSSTLIFTKLLLDAVNNRNRDKEGASDNASGDATNKKDDSGNNSDQGSGEKRPSGNLPVPRKREKKPKEDPITFDDIGGQSKAKAVFIELARAWNNPDSYRKWGIRPPRGICLNGPPGNGKTLFARALAEVIKLPFFYVDAAEIESKWWGESEKNINKKFAEAKAKGGVLFFDEADALVPARNRRASYHVDTRVIGAMNRNMDGFEQTDRVIVIFATNRMGDIDEAVLRPGRIDMLVEVPLPDREGRIEIFTIHMNRAQKIAQRSLFEGIEHDLLARRTVGFSGADIAEIVRRALAKKAEAESKGESPGPVIMTDVLYEIRHYERKRDLSSQKIGF